MEHEMKVSPSNVRRLRAERGWSQEQLAIASGLSLRTVQRVEAEGIASMGTVVSLAATYGIQVVDLQESESAPTGLQATNHKALFLGLAVITVAALGESGRLPGPQSIVFAAINLLACVVGALLAVPPLVRLVKLKQYIPASLAVIGSPLVTLMAAGVIFALLSGRVPTWQLVGIGAGGAALIVIALRELGRGGVPARLGN
jgi:transcriptional regulator with XRE-family HTH domain